MNMNTKNVTMETMEYFSSNSEARLRGRETLEVIIPDRYPDAREILLVTGYAYVKAKEQSGHPLLQSILEVVALVESSENSLYTIACEIPVTLHSELPEMEEACLFCSIKEKHYDATIVNSRKLSFSGEIGVAITQYHKKQLEYMTSIGEETVSIPCQWEICPRSLAITENFTISDELPFPKGKGDVESLLRKDFRIDIVEQKLIHEKLIVRANGKVYLSYLTNTGRTESVELDFPFTHVFELPGMDEGELPQIGMHPERLILLPQNREGEWLLSVTADIQAEVLCYKPCSIQSIKDGYSLRNQLSLIREEQIFPGELCKREEQVDTECNLEFPEEITEICDCFGILGSPVTYLLEDDRLRVVAPLTIFASGIGENTIKTVQKNIPVECYFQVSPTAITVTCDLRKIQAGPFSAGKYQLHVSVFFRITGEEPVECSLVTKVIQDEKDLSRLPSFVLTEAGKEDDLFSLGKRFNARPEDIRDANRLAPDDPVDAKKKILIPVCHPR